MKVLSGIFRIFVRGLLFLLPMGFILDSFPITDSRELMMMIFLTPTLLVGLFELRRDSLVHNIPVQNEKYFLRIMQNYYDRKNFGTQIKNQKFTAYRSPGIPVFFARIALKQKIATVEIVYELPYPFSRYFAKSDLSFIKQAANGDK